MTATQSDVSVDPRQHTTNIKRMLKEIITHVRQDTDRVRDPKAQALFETTAEVLQGLITAYEHYEGRAESAWR
jgi:hypothetical protein